LNAQTVEVGGQLKCYITINLLICTVHLMYLCV